MNDMRSKGRGPIGSRSGSAVLDEADIPAIRRLIADGYSHAQIAEQFWIGRTTVHAIRHGLKWAHVPLETFG